MVYKRILVIGTITLYVQIRRSAIDTHGISTFELKVSWMSKDEEVPLEYFMDVDGISRQTFIIDINPHQEGTIRAHFI